MKPDLHEFIENAKATYEAALVEWREAQLSHPSLGAYAAAHPDLGWQVRTVGGLTYVDEGWDPERHGTREEVEAAVDAWAAEQAKAAEEAAAAEAARLEEEAATAAATAAAREEAAATLEAAAATVQAALAAGKLDGPEVAEAYATIALAGAARLRG